ncbi:osteopetrosis-associated transmembrane protein 1 isoform X2 [Lampris incognitus]|uniref:osteopetrosis-associated transmembrane protein 1 isoform X2 n=1 Tax=Lampris incognitus TaxID=2546036 RepID=UPI0024B580D1|nr:osteopetrosis-associated transmembrane protein 1 isoform X2 [Lampris incognitus]
MCEPQPSLSSMSLCKIKAVLVVLAVQVYASAATDEANLTVLDSVGNFTALNSASVAKSPVLKRVVDPYVSLSLAAFPEDLEVSDYCVDLLHTFGQRYVAYVNCLVVSARPVKVCQNCYAGFGSLREIYTNISSDQMDTSNVSCRDSLLRSDRLMLVYLLYVNLEDIWVTSGCSDCVTVGLHSLTNDTLYFMAALNQSLTCFEKYQQGNHSVLCKDCKKTYKELNELYSGMEKNHTLCIDIEDAMNVTRRLWSKNFNCSFPREETVPVIAVSSFMLFLPIIFYLSSFLHSEQKKRKLIHPKRAKSSNSLMNIQDKLS